MSHDNPVFDIRVRERRLRDGKLDQADLDTFLAELPDDAENAKTCQAAMTSSAGDDAED